MENLDAVFSAGENSFVEFKDERVHPDSLAKEMASFANTDGGTVYLGVSDDGTVSGVSRPDLEEWVFNIARNNVKRSILPLFEKVEVAGRVVWSAAHKAYGVAFEEARTAFLDEHARVIADPEHS